MVSVDVKHHVYLLTYKAKLKQKWVKIIQSMQNVPSNLVIIDDYPILVITDDYPTWSLLMIILSL